MKKVLIISNIWPYQPGNFRVPGLTKWLPEFDWEPMVLTTPLPVGVNLGYRVIEVPYKNQLEIFTKTIGFDPEKGIRRQLVDKLGIKEKKSFLDFIFFRLREILYYPDSNQGWIKPAIKIACQFIDHQKFDAMISISPLVTSHIIASKVKEKYWFPWIADFPHLWSQDIGYPYSEFRRRFDRRLELKTMSNTNILVSVSEPLSSKLRYLHKNKEIHTITHGFDPGILNNPPGPPLTQKFSITFTGSWHKDFREPSMFFAALRNLILKKEINAEDIEVRFFGMKEIWIETEIEKYGLKNIVHQYGQVNLVESQARQRESHLLFQPKWNDPEEKGMMSSKIFEYLAACRPILATGLFKDVVDDVLEKTNAGVCAFSVEDTERILLSFYTEFKNTGEISYTGDIKCILKYSHKEMAGRFALLLNKSVASN